MSSVLPVLSEAFRTQQSSHAALCRARNLGPAPPLSRSARLDAVIVPTSRGATALDGAVHLATSMDATVVALCSKRTLAHEVDARFARVPGARVLAIDVPAGYRHPLLPIRTVAPRFRSASYPRRTDLSLKRNLGLLMARLRDWGRILFLDDDIGSSVHGRPTGLPAATAQRLAAALNHHQIAGLACRDFPDNSVVCHARRLAGFRQDTFVSGAALAVNCDDHPLPFFPDQYNEDWFFFSRRVAARDLAYVGDATQAAYDPFESPIRARQEEFGDVLAEGLFALFARQPVEMDYRKRLAAADVAYWSQFIAERRYTLSLIGMALEMASEVGNRAAPAAIQSLDAAADQLSRLTPELCADYLDAWATDLTAWEGATQRIHSVGTMSEVLDFLELRGSTTAAVWT